MTDKILLVLISLVSISIIYILIFLLIENINSKRYIEKIKSINLKEKISSISKIQKIKLNFIESCKISYNKVISPSIVVILSLFLSIVSFFIFYKLLNIYSSSIIVAIYAFFIPIIVLKYVKSHNKEKLFKEFPIYLSSLKNYTKTQNDIISAFKNCNSTREIKPYIDNFLYQVENGIKVYDAFEDMKLSINIDKISEFITLLEYCYLNGGNFTSLIDKYAGILMKINTQNEEQKEKELSTKIVLVVLIAIDVYMLFGFVYSNVLYKDIMVNTFLGNLIVNLNILSYFIMFLVFSKFKKMEG